ncbi:MAG: ABC transporter permease [Endomicrobium sp.]|jgi:putative ABC transport system permease protein|nr:ABC transporter permease [Endomicrobium sp.]
MFFRMVKGALFRQKGKMLMIAFTVALGVSLAVAMLNVMFDAGDKVNRELKTYGANINVIPKGASLLNDIYGLGEGAGISDKYLNESELGNIKTIFWAFNIVDFTPYLEMSAKLNGKTQVKISGTWFRHHLELPTGESLDTGMIAMKKWWKIQGEWLSDDDENYLMIETNAAAKNNISLGDNVKIFYGAKAYDFVVKGIFDSGSDEDAQVYLPLKKVQEITGKKGLVSRAEVSALTTPDNELSKRAAQNPNSLSIKEWETWYCTSYVSAVCYQIDEVITDSVSKPIRRVAQSEGAILEKTELLMLLITILSLAGAALGISNLVTASVMERSAEIGLLKAVGAYDIHISLLVITEIVIAGMIGAFAGYFAGIGFAQIIGHSVFGSAINIKPAVIPLVVFLVFAVIAAGSVPAVRFLLALRPAEVLHGR